MKTKILTYRAIIREDGKEFHGFVPILPGVHTSGITKAIIQDAGFTEKEFLELL